MPNPKNRTNHNQAEWERFCQLLWFDNSLGIWLDISRMKISVEDLVRLDPILQKSLESIQQLEDGSIANKDENRQVGHYWLRNPSIAPNNFIKDKINKEIELINEFTTKILNGEIRNKENKSFTDVLWIGIGGSGLGPLLIVEALQKVGLGLTFHFIDNVDSEGINSKLKLLQDKLKTTLIVVVSKSGGTPEPQIGMDQVRNSLEKIGGHWSSQAVAITMENSKLDNQARQENWLSRFDLPDWVGGRTSITGAVGILPINLVGSDSFLFLQGASEMDKLTRIRNIRNNPAALLAIAWLNAGESQGLRDMVLLPYKDRLQVFSRYLQQLVMESLGKKEDRSGKLVNQGIAVYGNKGSTDQHAYVQQLRDGIDNFFVTFIEVLKDSEDTFVINGRNPGDYLSGFLQGTRSALTEGDRQHLTISIREFNEGSLGALVALFERAVSIYAEIININAYHQPGVEAGKKAASEILSLQNKIEDLLSDGQFRTIEQICNLIPNSNPESVYFILRHLLQNNASYNFNGDMGKPTTLEFRLSK